MTDLDKVGLKCEDAGIYSVESQMKTRSLWVLGGDEIGLITSEGRIRVKVSDIPKMIEELQGLYADYKSLRGRALPVSKRVRMNQCREMLKAGKTYEEIAEDTHLTRRQIYEVDYRMKNKEKRRKNEN